MSAPNKHPNRATLLLSIVITLGLVAAILPMAETNFLSHETRSQPVIVPQTSPTGTYFDHLVFIILENAGISAICGSNLPPPCNGSNTPYMSSLANSYGIETQYVDLAGSSQPNYIGIMAATLNGCTSGCGSNSLTEINLVDRFEGAGVTWKAYMENQTPTTGCDNSDHGFYEYIHNPFVAFHDIDTNATRCNKIVLANPANNSTCTGTDCALINDLNSGSAPNFMWLTPNDCNNMHGSACSNGCTTSYTSACYKAGDNYLSGLVPNILNSNTFKNTRAALFITFDEGSGFCPSPNPSGADCMYTVWAGPTTKTNFSSNHADTHYFFTKTIETNWGLATMTSNDAGATAMTEFFQAPASDFSISASSPAPTNAGQSGTSTITVTALNGFSGTVSLTDAIPSGLTCGSISPNSIAGSGTATVSCSATNAGNYTLTTTGTSGSLIHAASALYQFRDFAIAASSVTANAGATGTSTITVTAINRFAGTVTLTDNVPSGLVCGSITPGTMIGSGAATVSCSATIAGNYSLTLTGTSGSLVHTALALFQYRDFTISVSSPGPANAGSSAIATITVNSVNQFGGTINLTDTVPSGLSCGSITPSSVTGSGTATISCTSTIAGNYTLTVIGTSGSLGHSVTALFQFRDFTTSATTPGPVDSTQSVTSTITIVALNHFNGIVNLTDSVPVGLTCGAITPTSVTGSGTATVSCSASVAGNYTLTITGSSGSLLHSATVVLRFQDFTITATSPAPVNAGQSPTSTVTVVAVNGFAGTVTFTITPPPGLTCGSFNPTSIIASGSTTVSCSATVAGNYTATITGTSTSLIHNATALFQFRDFTITSASPAPVNASGPASSTITLAAVNHFSGSISLTDTVPSGLACGSITPGSLAGSGTATVSCSATVAGNYTLTITGTSGSLSHSTTATFRFQDYYINANPVRITVNVGTAATSTITVTALNGFTGLVNLSSNSTACNLVPTGLTGSGSSTLSCTFSEAGSFHVTVTGASGSLSHSATITYTVQDFTINGSPASVTVNVGAAGTSTITITGLNGFAGVVSITTNSTSCTVSPTSLTGSGSATLSCTFASASTIHVAFNGTSGSLSHSATVTYTMQDFTLTAGPTSVTVLAGSAGTSSITITSLNGFTGLVNLATNSTSCTASPTSVAGSGNSTLSCTFASAGNVDVNVTGTSSGLSHSADAMYIVQDFALTVSPANITVYPDTVANSTIQITSLNGFAGVVVLATNSTASCAITPTSITGSGNATISCSFTGLNYSVIITGTNSTLSRTAMITVQTGTGSVGGVTLSIDRVTLLLQILPALLLMVTFATAGVIAVRAHLRERRNQNTERHKTDHLAPLEISL